MKSREGNIRSKRFEIEDKRRQVGQIESMIEEFNRMIGDLDHEICPTCCGAVVLNQKNPHANPLLALLPPEEPERTGDTN